MTIVATTWRRRDLIDDRSRRSVADEFTAYLDSVNSSNSERPHERLSVHRALFRVIARLLFSSLGQKPLRLSFLFPSPLSLCVIFAHGGKILSSRNIVGRLAIFISPSSFPSPSISVISSSYSFLRMRYTLFSSSRG